MDGRETILNDTEAIERLITQVERTSLDDNTSRPQADCDEDLLSLPGYYRGASPRYLPYMVAVLTMETPLNLMTQGYWMDQGELVKLIAAVLIVQHSLLAAYWDGDRLYTDGAYQFVETDPSPELVYRAIQIYHRHAGLQRSIVRLLLTAKQSWWETGEYVHCSRPEWTPVYLLEAIRDCGLDAACEEHRRVVRSIGNWTSTLKALSLLGIVTRDHFSLWHALAPLVPDFQLEHVCPTGNSLLAFCAITFRASAGSVVWSSRELDVIVDQCMTVYDQLCDSRLAIYHEAAEYLTGEQHVSTPPSMGALTMAVQLLRQCVPTNQCLALRKSRWFQLRENLPSLINLKASRTIQLSDETEVTLERLGEEIERRGITSTLN